MEEGGQGGSRKEWKPGFTKACKPQNKFLSVSKMASLFQMPLSQKNPSLLWSDCWVDWIGTKVLFIPLPHSPHSDIHFLYPLFAILKETVRKPEMVRTKEKHWRHQSWNKLGASVTSIHNDHVGGWRGGGQEESAMERRTPYSPVHRLV